VGRNGCRELSHGVQAVEHLALDLVAVVVRPEIVQS